MTPESASVFSSFARLDIFSVMIILLLKEDFY